MPTIERPDDLTACWHGLQLTERSDDIPSEVCGHCSMIVQERYLRAQLVLSFTLGFCQRFPLRRPHLTRMKSTNRFLCWLSQGGVERCPRSHRVELCSNIMTLHIGQLPVKLLRLDCKTDFRIIYSGDSDYFSVDGSMKWWSCTSLVKFLTAHTMLQSAMPSNAQGRTSGRFSIFDGSKKTQKNRPWEK